MAEQFYTYVWSNNEKRKKLKGRVCRIITTGKKNSVLVEFVDNGIMEIVSRRAIRRIENSERTNESGDWAGKESNYESFILDNERN